MRALFQGSVGDSMSLLYNTVGGRPALLGPGVMDSRRSASLHPDCCSVATQHRSSSTRLCLGDVCLTVVMKTSHLPLGTLKFLYGSAAGEITVTYFT